MLGVNVHGGTNAGRRIVRHLAAWLCRCGTRHPGARYSCPTCGDRRPS